MGSLLQQWRLAIVLAALMLGFWARVRGAFDYPFIFDETRVIQNGIRDMYGVGPDRHLGSGFQTNVFGVPLRNGNFLAPLWWWLQYVVRALSPNNETNVYRVVPVVSGTMGIAFFYRLAQRVFGAPLPELLACVLSVADVHVFVTTKSQWPEALQFPLAILMAYTLVVLPMGRRSYLRGGLAASVALGIQLGKGLAILATYLVTSVLQALTLRGGPITNRLRSLAQHWAVVGLAVIPMGFWWLGAETFFWHNPVRVHDLGYYGHLWEPIYDLTIGYGPHLRTHIHGFWYWPLLVYSHADAWPTSTYCAVLAVSGMIIAAWKWLSRHRTRGRLSAYVLVSIVLMLLAHMRRDADAPRNNILFLSAVLLSVGMTLEWLWRWAAEAPWKRLPGTAIITLTGLYTYIMFGWQRWPDQWIQPGMPGIAVLSFAILGALVYAAVPVINLRRAAVVGLVLMGVVLSLVRGPLHWGVFAYAEPGPTNPNLREVEIMYHPVQYYPPGEMQTEINAVFDDGLTLLGYDVERSEDELTLTLHWQTKQTPRVPYHSFVHLWDPVEEKLVLGNDTEPHNRRGLAMNQWLPGEFVSQTTVLDLSKASPGTYVLGTGLYNFDTGERLEAVGSNGVPYPNGWLPVIEALEVP